MADPDWGVAEMRASAAIYVCDMYCQGQPNYSYCMCVHLGNAAQAFVNAGNEPGADQETFYAASFMVSEYASQFDCGSSSSS
jgi:hypothetical protein